MSPWQWRVAQNQAGAVPDSPREGEAGGLYVTCDAVPRRVYLKPRKRDRGPFKSRAAREKIVADLACDLGVMVPPVLLFVRHDAPQGEETLCCVSLVLYRQQFAWHQIKRWVDEPSENEKIVDLIMRDLPVSAARALVLNAWVMQSEHDDHPHNIVFGLDGDGGPHFIYLDYALALGHRFVDDPGFRAVGWRRWDDEEGWKAPVTVPFPPLMLRHVSRAEVEAALSRVEDFPEDHVQAVVGRIPGDYLDDRERDILTAGLVGRRRLIRAPLWGQLGWSGGAT